jgi:SPP1 gp7 family putative phage head morphogenesis protein
MAKFPGDLESSYATTFKKLIESVNREYTTLLRQALIEEGVEKKQLKGLLTVNTTAYQKTLKRLKEIRERLLNKNLFKQTLKSMNNIVTRMGGRIEKDIIKQFEKEDFPIPKLALQADSVPMQEAIDNNVALISKITEEQENELSKVVERSLLGGSGPAEIVKEVKKISDNGTAYAEFVARDQIAKAHAAINKDMQVRAGFPGYYWRITRDGKVRDDHSDQKNKFFYWDDPPLLNNGNFHPGEDYRCRCEAEASFGPE